MEPSDQDRPGNQEFGHHKDVGPPWPVVPLPNPVWKTAMDLVGAVSIGIVTAPIWMLAAIVTRIFLGSPILFRQWRGGYGGTKFQIIKFRTMTDARDTEGLLLPDLERTHGWGSFLRRSSIDELPGLLNVLRGEMSLVGPRPFYAIYLKRFTQRHAQRHRVKPGITGLSQTQGRSALSWEERFELDLRYVEQRSVLLDLQILWATLRAVIGGRGADGVSLTTVYGGQDGTQTQAQE